MTQLIQAATDVGTWAGETLTLVTASTAAMSDGRSRFITVVGVNGSRLELVMRNDGRLYLPDGKRVTSVEGFVPGGEVADPNQFDRIASGHPCEVVCNGSSTHVGVVSHVETAVGAADPDFTYVDYGVPIKQILAQCARYRDQWPGWERLHT